MINHPKDPRKWDEEWDANRLSRAEYWQGLVYSCQFHEPDAVVSSLSPEHLAWFKDFLFNMTDGPNDGPRIRIGDPAPWRDEEAIKLRKFLEKRDGEEGSDWSLKAEV